MNCFLAKYKYLYKAKQDKPCYILQGSPIYYASNIFIEELIIRYKLF